MEDPALMCIVEDKRVVGPVSPKPSLTLSLRLGILLIAKL